MKPRFMLTFKSKATEIGESSQPTISRCLFVLVSQTLATLFVTTLLCYAVYSSTQSPQSSAAERIRTGNQLVRNQCWPEAITEYRAAIELDPTAADAYGNM